MLRALCDELTVKAASGNAQNTANAIYAISALQYHPGEATLRALEGAIRANAREFNSQNISNCGKMPALCGRYESLPRRLRPWGRRHACACRITRPAAAPPRSAAVLGFAKLEHPMEPEVLDVLGRQALAQLHTFTAQALSNTL